MRIQSEYKKTMFGSHGLKFSWLLNFDHFSTFVCSNELISFFVSLVKL
jgi:hypothetical protein